MVVPNAGRVLLSMIAGNAESVPVAVFEPVQESTDIETGINALKIPLGNCAWVFGVTRILYVVVPEVAVSVLVERVITVLVPEADAVEPYTVAPSSLVISMREVEDAFK